MTRTEETYWQYRERRGWRGKLTEDEAIKRAVHVYRAVGIYEIRPVYVTYGEAVRPGTLHLSEVE